MMYYCFFSTDASKEGRWTKTTPHYWTFRDFLENWNRWVTKCRVWCQSQLPFWLCACALVNWFEVGCGKASEL